MIFMNYRDFLQKVIYRIIDPLIKAMIRLGFTPNLVTTLGFIGNVVPYSHISTDRWKTFCHLYLKGISIHRCASRSGVCLKTAQYKSMFFQCVDTGSNSVNFTVKKHPHWECCRF